jgi:hypothetical protein
MHQLGEETEIASLKGGFAFQSDLLYDVKMIQNAAFFAAAA